MKTYSYGTAIYLAVLTWGALLTACRIEPTAPDDAGGMVIWKVPSDDPDGTPHEPTANADRSMAYFVTPEYRLRKIRGEDGEVMWDVPAGSPAYPYPKRNIVLSGGNVVVAKIDLFAFDTTTGAASWSYVAPDLDAAAYTSIVADDSTVYGASHTARIYAIDAHTGMARWIVDLREGQDDIGALHPTVADGELYVCTRRVLAPLSGTLWAIDAQTGAVRWRYHFTPELPRQGSRCFGYPAIWQDLVIQPQEDGRVFAFERESGAVRWIAPRVHDATRSLGDMGHAAAGTSTVLVTSQANEGMIVAYEAATGKELWRRTDIGGSLFPAAIEGDIAYVDHGWIYASYEMSTGKVRWQTPRSWSEPATPFKGRPVIAQDRIYVAGRDGAYALKR